MGQLRTGLDAGVRRNDEGAQVGAAAGPRIVRGIYAQRLHVGDVTNNTKAFVFCRKEYMYAFATQNFTQGYRYKPQDCEFWAHVSIQDSVKENSRCAFYKLMPLRLQHLPDVDSTWSMLYVGANELEQYRKLIIDWQMVFLTSTKAHTKIRSEPVRAQHRT
eukprot:GEMP01068110.1.p1 GENE.GEMP01068110.1~~GEMP01068110.1.p1  ORF type:complete len:161 (+),score=26.20 GEMP01068110.1:3-485(+)